MVVKGWVDDEMDINTGYNHLYDLTVTTKDLQDELNELGNEAFETAEFLGAEKDNERLATVVRSMWEYLSRVMYMCERYYTRSNITVDLEKDKGRQAFMKALSESRNGRKVTVKDLIAEIRESCGDMLEAAADMADETDEENIFVIVNCVMDCLCWLSYLCSKYWDEHKKEHEK